MKSKAGFIENIKRKIIAGSFTIIFLVSIYFIVSAVLIDATLSRGLSELQEDTAYTYIILFYGVFFYGVPVSVISDSLAKSIAITTRQKEIYMTTILHLLAGSIVGLGSLIPAVTFLVIDRLIIRKPIHFRFGAIMFISLCAMTYLIDVSIKEVFGLS
ncbi:hypothetical protein [Anaerobacillus sp. 1_MG-2023]|uniref:hypothetical protein n=1 Tax=Anaerobacillus sp. 1_MG-2023 TaxID=3062655 RepID=UPI0026E1C38A|nr:hypothetical protein [Anaerobacillus sp. 1_MG-2023]MDO6654629.1 hypothetical protein [Anaerobacillus sp. 1_MG-2023]